MGDFSTTVTVDVSVSDEFINVMSNDGARTTYPWRAVIDDEVVYVQNGVQEGLLWYVRRGADDTDPAWHPAGSILEAVRVGEFTIDEPLIEDGSSPAAVLTTEDGADWLRSDPIAAGV
jgi:hypothetical protein